MSQTSAGQTRGFTLIELMIVIVIVGVLALLMGILLPALSRVRKQGKSVVCCNNLRQVGMGANLYAENYEQFIPRGHRSPATIEPWFILFMPYLSQKPIDNDYRNVKIFRCPSHLPMSDDTSQGSGRRVAKKRHRRGCNVLYLDWHVAYMDAEDMTKQQWILEK